MKVRGGDRVLTYVEELGRVKDVMKDRRPTNIRKGRSASKRYLANRKTCKKKDLYNGKLIERLNDKLGVLTSRERQVE